MLMANKPQGVELLMGCMSTLSPIIARHHTGEGMTLAELLVWTSAHKATDPRDKIFALIGLTTSVSSDFIDYNHDIRQVLIDTCRLFFTQNSAGMEPVLGVLSFVNHAYRSIDLPSWVPEWGFKGDSFCALNLIMRPREWIEIGEASYTTDHEEVREAFLV